MSVQTYELSVVESAQENALGMGTKVKFAVSSLTTAAMLAVPTMVSMAETTGTNIIDSDTMAVITSSFSNLAVTATALIVMGMTASVSVMLLSQACDYALKRMKAAFRKAA